MIHFPLFQIFPSVSEKFFRLHGKFSNFTYSRKILRFSSAKISDDLLFSFLVINYKFGISPLFSLFHYISPLFRKKILFPPAFKNFPPAFVKLTCFYMLSVYFVQPYFYHDAFMQDIMHVLDATD